MTNLTKMLSKFITSNTASSSNSRTLPSQTVTNPHEHVNAITTRSGKTCEGPSTPLVPTPVVSTPLKEPEKKQETSMDKVQKPSSEKLDRTNALADSEASINLLPHSIYKQLGLGALKPTRMTLELANRSVTHPMGIAEDVVVRVDGFTFLADFVVVNFEPGPRVPIILGRPFLRTAKALIDLYEEKLTLRVESEEFNLEDIFQIQDVILREKLLNVHRLISNIESLEVNPTPDRVLESPSPFPIPVADSDSFLEKSDTPFSYLDNSLPEFETSSDYTEETRSGSTTTHANYSLPEYDSFLFEIEPDQEVLISIDNSNNFLLELPEFESFHFDPSFPRPPPEPPDVCLDFKPDTVMKNNEDFNQREIVLSLNVEDVNTFTFVIWTFLPFFTYPEDSPVILSFRNEDLVFDPGISTFHFSFKPVPFALPKDK
ncbi:reverse transcriptase domain-containing protein [Tanacetum coccineum]|uniref:Reverse transcriptase domain-containing protein n=1 Tax=Tanacetum coccineum TaxID=301880 RepID=A0ABQ5DH36_9ASTR